MYAILIHSYTLFSHAQMYVARVARKVYAAIQLVLAADQFVLFNQNATPWPLRLVDFNRTPNAAWLYNADTNALYEYSSFATQPTPVKSRHFPFLSLEVRDSKQTHDLSDFIQSTNLYKTTDTYPNMGQIVALWSVNSRTVIDYSKPVTISFITDAGDSLEKEFDPRSTVEQLFQA
jgi:hypothetical protein